jgi:hypothetical protein
MQRATGEVLALVAALHAPESNTHDVNGQEDSPEPRNVFAYPEGEAATILRLSPRTLADQRRKGMLKGNYSRVGRNIFYMPEHLKAILELFSCVPRSRIGMKGGKG